jgi:hypothetical protein
MKRRRSLYARPQPFSTIAVRRGAAWLARPSSCVGASGSLTLERWPAAEPSWLPSAAGAVPVGAVPRNTVGRPSAPPLGVAAQEVRMPAVPSSPCPCPRPVSGASVQRPRVPVARPLSSVRCGRLSVRVSPSGVQGWGVRCPCAPVSAMSDREIVEGGGGQVAARLRSPGSQSPAVSTISSRLPESNRAIEAGAGLLGQRRASAGLGRRRGKWLGSGRVDLVAAGETGCARESPVARGAGRRSEVATTLRGHRVRPWVESPRL